MKELQVTWVRAIEVWWAMCWRGIVYAMLPAFLLGAVAGIVLAVNKIPIEPHERKLQLAGAAIGVFAGIWIVKVILNKTYSGFRIVLVKTPAAEMAVEKDASAGAHSEGPTQA